MGRALTGVGGMFCAAHACPNTGRMHGHTWEVTAWFTGCPEAAAKQRALNRILGEFDHSTLPPELAWGEHIAAWVASKFDDTSCVQVDVSRPSERIFARWER